MTTLTLDILTANVDEYVQFTQVFNLITDPATPIDGPWFTKVLSVAFNVPFNIGVSNSDTVVTFTGVFEDAFSRPLKYLDNNGKKAMVDGFRKLPSDYEALYSYTAPSATTIVVPFTLSVYFNTVDYINASPSVIAANTVQVNGSFTVRNNWQYSLAAFLTSLSAGSTSKRAIAAGYV